MVQEQTREIRGFNLYLDDIRNPSEPGVTLTGLKENTVYYFAITAFDNENNCSGYSNIISHTTQGGTVNHAPTVNAGDDRAMTWPDNSASMQASVSDDGLPSNGELTITWRKAGGPGTVGFTNPGQVDTLATFDAPGVYSLELTASDGELSASDTVTITVTDPSQSVTVSARTASSNDDAEEDANSGSMYMDSSDLELVSDDTDMQIVGMRFAGLDIPQGAHISSAYIEFETDETDTQSTNLSIIAQNSDNAQAFGTSAHNISSRPTVNASVAWNNVAAWNTVNEKHRSPDLSALVQAIVNRQGWSSGNAMVFVVTGSGCRTAESFDGESSAAPVLNVAYNMASNDNEAPVVNAGTDQTITLPVNQAALNAEVTDDGNPTGQSLETVWTKVSGPGTVSFANPGQVDTQATFEAAGVYVLKLTASDGELSASDQLIVTVLNASQTVTISSRVASSNDDAEEYASSGYMYLDSSDLELVSDDDDRQLVGMRFTGLTIPQGASISSAYIEFETDETDTQSTSLSITAQDSDNAQAFGADSRNISSRPTVNATATWNNVTAWNTVNEKHRTPDLSALVQAVVNRQGWTGGNAMVFVVTGSGCRIAESYDGESSAAPFLQVAYTSSVTPTVHTISASAGAHGSMTPAGAVEVANGGGQTFTITPDPHYSISDVMVDGVSVGTPASYTFDNVTKDHTIAAVFAADTFNISASAGANGSISPAGTTNVALGGNLAFTITADDNYRIADVLVDNKSMGAVSTYTFSNVQANHAIQARFEQDTVVITASCGTGGSISPSGQLTLPKGGSQSFSITPNTDYQTADVRVDGVSVGKVSAYTFSNVMQNCLISASFEKVDTQAPTTPSGLAAEVSGLQVNLAWQPSSDNVGVTGYTIYRDGGFAGTTAATSFIDNSVEASRTYSYSVEAKDAAGNISGRSAAVAVTVEASTVEIVSQINSSNDDAEEMKSSGWMYTDSTDLELVSDDDDNQIIGLRFTNLAIPQGARITSAYLEFETDETDTVQTDVTITAQNSDNAETFGSGAHDISNRSTVNAAVAWNSIDAWRTVNEKHRSPDVSTVVQAVVNRADWISGNAMAFLIGGSGCRTAESYDGEPDAAPKLYVTYVNDPDANAAPVVDAGEDLSITLPENSVVLNADITDDGKPSGMLSVQWTVLSGPGNVFFEDARSAITGAEFSSAGTYLLKIEANDGELSAGDQLTVTVRESGGTSTYEGFGAVTQGAAGSPTGYDIYHVTSLSDSGTGTLRDALSRGNRRVVFDVGGTIVLQSDLNIPYSYITIDGSSAPSPGITIVQPGDIKTTIEAKSSIGAAHDIIIHHLRMDGQASGHTNDGDIWGLDGESAPVYNIILDHITAMASTDGIFDIWEDVHDVTISWNLITDTVAACHLSTGDTDKARRRISIHHNVFAHNNERQIRMRHNNQLIDFVNNVIYGWGWMESGASGLHIAYDSGETNPSANVVNNVYHYVSGLSGSQDSAIIFESGSSVGDVYFSGNLLPGGENDAVSTSGQLSIPSSAQVTLYAADTLRNSVVPYVGTHYPLPDEQQLLGDVQSALNN